MNSQVKGLLVACMVAAVAFGFGVYVGRQWAVEQFRVCLSKPTQKQLVEQCPAWMATP